MKIYSRVIFPFLCRFDPERTHDIVINLLERAQASSVGRPLLRTIGGRVPRQEVTISGLTFPNPIGVAAGFDKDARIVESLSLLGFGHIEVGTLTPNNQPGNPKPRIFRLRADKALINRMGFPSEGAKTAHDRLQESSLRYHDAVLGVSIGKQKETPLNLAVNDYVSVMRTIYSAADYFAINISSPNTPGLRDLQLSRYLDGLLKTLNGENLRLAQQHAVQRRPLFVKISPDQTWSEIDSILEYFADKKIDGIIATNTTVDRTGLNNGNAGEVGGLSGLPLASRSNEIIAYITRATNGELPVIGAGGVFTAQDVRSKLDAGAVLVQVYTGLVYEGPGMVGRILRELEKS